MDRLTATPGHCFWGFLDPALDPVLTVDDGTELTIEAVTHHAGDAPDLLMDDGVRALWDGIPEADRAPGVHIMTGPIAVSGASPGDSLVVEILEMTPRLPYGSNCAANWGLLYDTFGKERITIYGLTDATDEFPPTARPLFGFDFDGLPTYDVPGFVTPPNESRRRAVRPRCRGRGAPASRRDGRRARGARPPQQHPARRVRRQRRQLAVRPGRDRALSRVRGGRPLLRRRSALRAGRRRDLRHRHRGLARRPAAAVGRAGRDDPIAGPGDGHPLVHPRLRRRPRRGDADGRRAGRAVPRRPRGYTPDEAYSLASVAVDVGVTQVVDATLGCHAAIPKSLL